MAVQMYCGVKPLQSLHLNEMNNCDWKGKTDTNRKPFEWEKRTDNEPLMNGLQSVRTV